MNHVSLAGLKSVAWALIFYLSACTLVDPAPPTVTGDPWQRHTIDNSSLGAEGVRLRDINSDGRLDITTPWEQGGHRAGQSDSLLRSRSCLCSTLLGNQSGSSICLSV